MAEICDSKDNNCDGVVDEHVTNDCGGCAVLAHREGDVCHAGAGVCLQRGAFACDGTEATACEAVASDGVPEVCDRRDNDCDGDLDEDNVCTTVVSPRLAGSGCAAGACATWSMPDITPSSMVKPSYAPSAQVVVDRVTQLVWQRSPPVPMPGCGNFSAQQPCLWAEAKVYCENLTLDAQGDWRLPSKIELESLLDDSMGYPAIDTAAFPDAPTDRFWSATPVPGDSGYAYDVLFGSGATDKYDTGTGRAVRCVRGGVSGNGADARYTKDATLNVVLDNWTGLTWELAPSTATFAWADAMEHCDSAGTGYRLPTKKEALTLVNATKSDLTVDTTVFSVGSINPIWTATEFYDRSVRQSWRVNLADGTTAPLDRALVSRAWCVR